MRGNDHIEPDAQEAKALIMISKAGTLMGRNGVKVPDVCLLTKFENGRLSDT